MKNLRSFNNPYRDDKVFEGCAIFALLNQAGKNVSGEPVFRAIANMRNRGNGLGGGFAVYGIYPEYAEHYALHVMYDDPQAREEVENCLKNRFDIAEEEEVPTRKTPGVNHPPQVFRYFLKPRAGWMDDVTEDERVIRTVMDINIGIKDAFVFSSGKNMGVFKGVGHPETMAEYFRLDEYRGYLWTAHSRFPTNSRAWWGGAHPFSILDWTVIHNGEISSYGINRRYLEMHGYACTLETDTEVLNDRIRLRPMTAGIGGENLYISSEEASIRLVCPELDEFWSPQGGDPIVGKVKLETPALYAPVRPLVSDEDRAGLKVGGLI
ncbi:MAG: hypothetical protein NT056_08775 [Proteobacteria bacterium]|nr:hypothetical protein [Pseudomonadota bacterium]